MRSSGCLSCWDKRLKSSVSEVVFYWLEIIVEVDADSGVGVRSMFSVPFKSQYKLMFGKAVVNFVMKSKLGLLRPLST